jgi:hypothetical protein
MPTKRHRLPRWRHVHNLFFLYTSVVYLVSISFQMGEPARLKLRLAELFRTPDKNVHNSFLSSAEPKTTRSHWQFEFRGIKEIPHFQNVANEIHKRFSGTTHLSYDTEPIVKVFVPRSYAYYSGTQRVLIVLLACLVCPLLIYCYLATTGHVTPF